jgi:hypothetical protein
MKCKDIYNESQLYLRREEDHIKRFNILLEETKKDNKDFLEKLKLRFDQVKHKENRGL